MYANAIAAQREQDDEVGIEEPTVEGLLLIEQEESEEEAGCATDATISAQEQWEGRIGLPISAFSCYFKELSEGHLLSAQQERSLIREKEKGNFASRKELIVCNLRLVVKIAKKYAKRGVPFLDLIQEGNLGLVKGIDRFKSSGGCRVSTYVTWWIRQSMGRAVFDQARTIRVPVGMEEFLMRRRRAVKYLLEVLGRLPEREELIHYMHGEDVGSRQVTAKGEERALKALRKRMRLAEEVDARERAVSLEWLVSEGESTRFSDFLEDIEGDLEAAMQRKQEVEKALQLMETLTAPEQEILRLRFGVESDHPPMTLDVIASRKGVTRERIRQIEAKALKKIRDQWSSLERREGKVV